MQGTEPGARLQELAQRKALLQEKLQKLEKDILSAYEKGAAEGKLFYVRYCLTTSL
jgi:hypothetical protein